MFDCLNCDLSAEQCICGKVDKFFKENKHLMNNQDELDELDTSVRRNRKKSDLDFFLDDVG